MILGLPPQIAKVAPPYLGWPLHHIKVLETAITFALQLVCNQKSKQEIESASENDITNWLEATLFTLLDSNCVAGYISDVFDKPSRGAEVENFDGTKISLKPDLLFRRSHSFNQVMDARQDAWFCECKILDARQPTHDLGHYQRKGTKRFLDGDYAWAMPHAQMIAYVREPQHSTYSSKLHLTSNLQSRKSKPKTHEYGEIFCTVHPRTFTLLNGEAPGDITLRHLWFKLQ